VAAYIGRMGSEYKVGRCGGCGTVQCLLGRFLLVAVRCQRRFRRHISTGLIGLCSSIV